jgi:hypothetical protein
LSLLIWLLCSLGAALSSSHRLLSERLRGLTPLQIAGMIVLLGAAVVFVFAEWMDPSWLVCVLAVAHLCAASRRPAFAFVLILLLVLITLAPFEGLLIAIRSNPVAAAWHPLMRNMARVLYKSDWNIIQWDPACAQFDAELSYTLRPGTCIFSNTEFTTRCEINRLGVRDDEESLGRPEIVALGDSHTMGWGVAQAQTFAQRLEKMTGRKVLNAGISSYGTARELLLLKRIDTSQMRFLILQYYGNDLPENLTFIQNGYALPGRTPDWFDTGARSFQANRRYFPGKYLRLVVAGGLGRVINWFSPPPPPKTPDPLLVPGDEHARVLLDVLEHSPVDLSTVRVIVFASPVNRPLRFAAALHELLAARPSGGKLNHVDVLDPVLRATDVYLLDGHENASGHAKLASELLRGIAPHLGERPQAAAGTR